jgi:hypothetical protein
MFRLNFFFAQYHSGSANPRFVALLDICSPKKPGSVKLEQLHCPVCAGLYSRKGTGPMLRQLTSNEHLDYIAALLDDMFRIPGTQIRFGLDALIGWVPGIGDAMAGIASFLIVFASWRRGVQAITLVRMIANVLLETTIGAIPVAGDVFHVFWKANRRNYRLLMREKEQPGANAGRDRMFLAIILFTVIAAAGIPIGILIWILRPH